MGMHRVPGEFWNRRGELRSDCEINFPARLKEGFIIKGPPQNTALKLGHERRVCLATRGADAHRNSGRQAKGFDVVELA